MEKPVKIEYDRDRGFPRLEDELKKQVSPEAFEMIKAHATAMEKDPKLRDVTKKTFIRVLLIVSLIVLILLLVLANILSASICFLILVALAYFFGIVQATRLKKLSKEYDLKISGSDWDYFGCKIENKFGERKWKFYAIFIFVKPTISLNIQVLKKFEPVQRVSLRDIDNGLIIGKLSGRVSQPAQKPEEPEVAMSCGQKSEPEKKKKLVLPVIGSLNHPQRGTGRYKEDLSIDLGNHQEPADQGARLEQEKLFDKQ